ncbi:hypothetical protein QYM36_004080 [Artemia franciscana]|nr:hypothetical protein QYM36_004080 [Artemia franciscana]KAK2720048.1 hypothetical protein QYM36_004080 [Artemia franciscana]
MAKGFGELSNVRGIIKYSISPFEQRAFAGAISKGLPNLFRRFRSKFFIVAPPFMIAYYIYDQTEKAHARMMRKNPADFANDV